jgi:hypothetical protein
MKEDNPVPPHEDRRIQLVVVVSGQPLPLTVNPSERLEVLVRQALNDSGNHGQPPDEWELRREEGTLLDQSLRVGEAGLQDGMTLFLNPRTGAGG